MAEVLKPSRGGFLRPVGCGEFIVSFLKGEGPMGATRIDASVGAPQADIQAEYKMVLHRSFAEDMVAIEGERRARRGLPPYTVEEAERRTAYWMGRIPMKFTRARYHSFVVYFGMLKRLGWVEATDREEKSTVQDYYPHPPAQPRRYYRLTAAGRAASRVEIMNPLRVLYPQFTAEYFRQHRSQKHYTSRSRSKTKAT